MTTAGIRAMIAAAGLATGLAAPALAQVGQVEEQAIARSLAEQGYSDIRIAGEGDGVTVSARREGEAHSFAWDREEGRLEPVGGGGDPAGDDGRRGAEAEGDDNDGPGDEGRSGAESGDDGSGGDDDGPGDDGRGGDEGRGGGDGGHGGDHGGGDDGGRDGAED